MTRCELCNDQEKHASYRPRLAFDFTPDEITLSARVRRCESCTVILESLRQAKSLKECSLKDDVQRVYARCRGEQAGHADTLTLEVYFIDDRPKIELELYSRLSKPWKAILPRPSISGHPLSPLALSWVGKHLETCQSAHEPCSNVEEAGFPTRILALQEGTDGQVSVQLVEHTPKKSKIQPYVALSHVWGKERGFTTTTKTIESRKENIPWDMIPKTFQHVIALVLKLGFKFIWIDSLCIIQDDLVDWQIESSKMADVYQNATLTIAATASANDSIGCFPEEEEPLSDEMIVLPEGFPAQELYVRDLLKHWDNRTHEQMKKHFPLLSRGWVYQERLLSPRTLHICENELVWECRECVKCECGGANKSTTSSGLFHQAINNQQFQGQAALSSRTASKYQNEDEYAKIAHFHQIVEAYSKLELSKQTDRLPALSGLCQRLHSFRLDYVAGLWFDSICADLMWRVDSLRLKTDQLREQTEYVGPTWSWIFIEGPVIYWTDLTSFAESAKTSEARIRKYKQSLAQYERSQEEISRRNRSHVRPGRESYLRANSISPRPSRAIDREFNREPVARRRRGPPDIGDHRDRGSLSQMRRESRSPASHSSVEIREPLNYPLRQHRENNLLSPSAPTNPYIIFPRNSTRSRSLTPADMANSSSHHRSRSDNRESSSISSIRRTEIRLPDHDNVPPELVIPVPLGQNKAEIEYAVKQPGKNPFGAIEGAYLKLTASAVKARVCYDYDIQTRKVVNLFKYSLTIEVPEVERLETHDIPFFADYILALPGPRHVPDETVVTLLLVHPKVCLVLRERGVWERIGIVRIPEELLTYYEVDWMRNSKVERFKVF